MTSPFEAVRRLSASSLGLLLTRAEFALVELAQSRAQLMRWLGLALVAAVFALLALTAASAALVILLWERAGPLTLWMLAALYVVTAILAVRRLQRELHEAPPLLVETLAELARDRDALMGRASSEGSSSPGTP